MALETLRATSSDSFPANLQSMIPGSASSAWVALLDLFAEIILRDQGKVNLFWKSSYTTPPSEPLPSQDHGLLNKFKSHFRTFQRCDYGQVV